MRPALLLRWASSWHSYFSWSLKLSLFLISSLSILALPTITIEPQSQVVAAGGTVIFQVTAVGDGPLEYLWLFNGEDLQESANVIGTSTPTLTLRNVRLDQVGVYEVIVADSDDVTISLPAQLSVQSGPSLVLQPKSLTVVAGGNATFSVQAATTGAASYQWFFNGVALSDNARISGATRAALTITGVGNNDSGSYSVRVKDEIGTIISSAATLTVTGAGPVPGNGNRWTILIYGHADHNLSASLVTDIQEMETAGSGKDFNIVVQADFDASSDANTQGGLPAELSGGITRFLINQDSNPRAITSQPVERLPESINMDNPQALSDFIVWAAQKYPADRYALVMWNHGGQWQGFGGDSQDGTLEDKGSLSTAQIRSAVSNAMQAANLPKWEFIAFDTCLMGGVEVLSDFVSLTDVFIACPEIDYGDGWNYGASFSYLKANPSINALEFGKREAKDWQDQHMVPQNEADLALAAHAVYDLTKFNALEQRLNSFARELRLAATPGNIALPRTRLDTTQYSLEDVRDIGQPTDFIDIGEFAKRVAGTGAASAELKLAAQQLVESINGLVVAKVLGEKKTSALGLSIYYPQQGQNGNQAYLDLNFSKLPDSAWPLFLQAVSGNAAGDIAAPTVKDPDAINTDDEGNISNQVPTPGSSEIISASLEKPALIDFEIAQGVDAYSISATLVSTGLTGNTNDHVYLGEVVNAPADGEGEYKLEWDAALPYLTSTAGNQAAILGAFFEDVGSDILVSFAQYLPPNSDSGQLVILLTQVSAEGAQVINVLDGESEELAPEGIELHEGGELTPIYYVERRVGNDADQWEEDAVLASESIIVPPNGIAGLHVEFAEVPDGIYNLELQVEDVYENSSGILEYFIQVGGNETKASLRLEAAPSGKIKLSWPASETGFVLEANSTLSAAGWVAIPADQIVTEGNNRAFIDNTTGQSRFYRLRKP